MTSDTKELNILDWPLAPRLKRPRSGDEFGEDQREPRIPDPTEERPPPETTPTPGPRQRTLQKARNAVWRYALSKKKLIIWTFTFTALVIALPLVFLRVATLANQHFHFDGWSSLGVGALSTFAVIAASIALFALTVSYRPRVFALILNLSFFAIISYSGYALFYLSSVNAKSEQIRDYYTALHPLLRLAVTNLSLFDDELVITATKRTPAEYVAMGIKAREASLHYKQRTGFVHAVDIRTIGRSKLKNYIVEKYFRSMGFDTIRHVGTADHLHVSLSPANGYLEGPVFVYDLCEVLAALELRGPC